MQLRSYNSATVGARRRKSLVLSNLKIFCRVSELFFLEICCINVGKAMNDK